ncbi:MAG: FHA domain-containing protein [Magnetococcales bacterium]|nr:FHA domain-containing protein [Magnetococcales bacterium]
MADAKFIITQSDVFIKEIPLDKEIVTIGRGWGNDVRIPYDSLSRMHAQVMRAGPNKYLIKDLASKNGTFVNDSKVREHRLKHKDRVTLGKYTLTFLLINAPGDS